MLYRLFALLLQQAEAVWRTVVKTGTGLIVANDTTENQPVKLEMQGWTEQNQYEGKNLLNNNFEIFQTDKSRTYVELKAGQYILTSNRFIGMFFLNEDGSCITNGWTETNKMPFSIDEDETVEFRFSTASPQDYELMLNEGSIALPYEPYTGGQPSPSPEYPQEIVNAGKYNEETQKYEVVITISDKEQEPTKQQTVTVTSDRPITKWDRLVEKDGVIGWEYGGDIYEITGDDSPGIGNVNYYTGSSYCGRINLPNTINSDLEEVKQSKCSILKYFGGVWNSKDAIGFAFTTKEVMLRIYNSVIGVNDDDDPEVKQIAFLKLLSEKYERGNPVTVVYPVLTPEFVPLPSEEQELLKSLKTYYPTTVFSNDGEMFMQVEYQTKVPEQEV